MSVLHRNNVQVSGRGARPMMFAHGFGCDQNMWRLVAPAFEQDFKIVLFDHVGAGGSDLSAYRPEQVRLPRRLCRRRGRDRAGSLDLEDVSVRRPLGQRHDRRAGREAEPRSCSSAWCWSGPRRATSTTTEYVGGFSAAQIEELLDFLDNNHMGWSTAMAPTIMGNADRPELGEELTNSFCRTDPEIAKHFARITFTSDNRADLDRFALPSLILQCSDDVIAPNAVGEYRPPASSEQHAGGHAGDGPLSESRARPEETIAAIRAFV